MSSEIEGGWGAIDKFLVSVMVSWDKENGIIRWLESDTEDFLKYSLDFAPYVSYNGDGFDYKVLSHYGDISHFAGGSHDLCTFMRKREGHRVHLDQIGEAMFGKGKTADGLKAVEWWRTAQLACEQQVIDYCTADVMLTKDIYFFARKHGYIEFVDKYNRRKRSYIGSYLEF